MFASIVLTFIDVRFAVESRPPFSTMAYYFGLVLDTRAIVFTWFVTTKICVLAFVTKKIGSTVAPEASYYINAASAMHTW